jgi:YbgC/YbaW family acyl-CoA thioester hydrolase
MQIKPYQRRAWYYETDQMGVIHHANYIRWFEEARMDLMDQCGIRYAQMEQDGVIIPVLSVSCTYKSMVCFDETILIAARIAEYTGVRMTIEYAVTDKLTTGAPYFVEMGHSLPSRLPPDTVKAIEKVACAAINAIGIETGASHTEILMLTTKRVQIMHSRR